MRVEEQDGSVQEFKMNTANIPYDAAGYGALQTGDGQTVGVGAPSARADVRHRRFSGDQQRRSLYGRGIAGGDYNALGIGRDLMALGALSFDATQSRVRTFAAPDG